VWKLAITAAVVTVVIVRSRPILSLPKPRFARQVADLRRWCTVIELEFLAGNKPNPNL
jgi:hypothetical protein